MHKLKLAILRNEDNKDYFSWARSCDNFSKQISYEIVNLVRNNWLDEVRKVKYDLLLAKPPGRTAAFKQLYDERITILARELNYNIFPSLAEILLHENKRYLSYWLKANEVPHPETSVFYQEQEALDFLDSASFPLVAKINIGASGKGIEILSDKPSAQKYTWEIFTTGKLQKAGPNLNKGNLLPRLWKSLLDPRYFKNRLQAYRALSESPQKGFILLQEFIPHSFEWRVVRIGDSFFAHKKIVKGEKASGTLIKEYVDPPMSLLDFVKTLTDRHRFYSQAVDVFESAGRYLVNEMQCIFGQSDPYQMLVDGKPGRYRFLEGEWVFEEGDYARNECYDLRLEYLLEKTDKSENQIN